MSSPGDLPEQVGKHLDRLIEDGTIVNFGTSHTDGRFTIFIGIDAQTDHLAPDYNRELIDQVRSKLRDGLAGIPFQILGDYSEENQADLLSPSRNNAKNGDNEGLVPPQKVTLQPDTDIIRGNNLSDFATRQHVPTMDAAHGASFVPDDVTASLNDIASRLNLLERTIGVVSLQIRAAKDDLREKKDLIVRVSNLEQEISRLASKRFVVVEGYIIIVVLTFLIALQDIIHELMSTILNYLRTMLIN
jgi:hypothetical protein